MHFNAYFININIADSAKKYSQKETVFRDTGQTDGCECRCLHGKLVVPSSHTEREFPSTGDIPMMTRLTIAFRHWLHVFGARKLGYTYIY